MSVNSSSTFNLSFAPPHSSSNSSVHPLFKCFNLKSSIFGFSVHSITYILFLPLPIYVLYLGCQKRRKQCSSSTSGPSHCDVFTYHTIVMQLFEATGFSFFLCGSYVDLVVMMFVGYCVWSVSSFGQALLHLLTCVERYLAVVHPVTYLGLRQSGSGVRIRNVITGGLWVLCVAWLVIIYQTTYNVSFVFYLCVTIVFLIVIPFCSISVLCALKRPGPGDVGGNRSHADQSKQRAFHTIMAVLGVLLLSFGGNMIANVMNDLNVLSNGCVVLMCTMWFDLPSRLVLPLLYLQRAGKLRCRKHNTESE